MLEGKVMKGSGRGGEMGIHTINIPYKGEDSGVFVGKVLIKGEWLLAAINLGGRPTFDDKKFCEVHVVDWKGHVALGTKIDVQVFEKIRDIEKFEDADALKKQIKKDIQFARDWAG
ncbi:riboflavin kinase [Candidatus Gracilibacteria bacterium]|nr:riboflavin kinase [Candidatus Gracilibacteria bacterium]